MMKPLNTLSNQRMLAYSIFANFSFLTGTGQSELIYEDINPDIVLDAPDDSYFLDMDQDGNGDFIFYNFSFTIISSSTWYGTYNKWYRQDLLAKLDDDLNAILGSTNYIETYYEGFNRYYPFAMVKHQFITPDQNWMDKTTQILVIRDMQELGTSGYFQAGNWFPIQTDKYLGVRFTSSGKDHYGWIRCDVLDNGRSLVIKDYAYESQPELGVITGYQSSIDQPDETFHSNVYSFNGVIHISFNFQFTIPVQLSIIDSKGAIVYTLELTDSHVTVNTEIPNGIYVLHLYSEQIDEAKEITIQR